MNTYAIKLKDAEELSKYADHWVALSPKTKEIIAWSTSAKEALELAISEGEDDPILTRIPKRFDSYVL